jgi:TRAP-type C4-dicarboxylate transport system permease small subunit
MSPEPRRPRLRDLLFAVYVLCCVGALTWPGYEWLGNRIEPYVLGIPFSLGWIVGWVVLSFIALVLYHATDRPRRTGG